MARENFVAVFGHTNVDHITMVQAFPPMNQSIQIEGFEHLWGGTAANVAAVAGMQEVPVALASFVGKGFPPQFNEHLRSLGLDLEDLEIAQCVFVGDEVTTPHHVGIIARGNGIVVRHCVFRGLKISVVYWTGGSTGQEIPRPCSQRYT